MSKVRVYELSKAHDLRDLQSRINARLAPVARGLRATLVRSTDGAVGYSLQGLPAAGGRALLDATYAVISEELGIRRGRPRSEATHQVKCRVSETAYERLKQEARRRRTTPSGVLADLVERHARAASA